MSEWVWAVLIIAMPFVLFGALELTMVLRRRREMAVARRPKNGAAGRTQRSMRRSG